MTMATGKYENETASQVSRQTCITRLSSALDRLRKADGYVSEFASKLVGEGPGEGSINKCVPAGGGLLGFVDEMAVEVDRLADSIVAQIERMNSMV